MPHVKYRSGFLFVVEWFNTIINVKMTTLINPNTTTKGSLKLQLMDDSNFTINFWHTFEVNLRGLTKDRKFSLFLVAIFNGEPEIINDTRLLLGGFFLRSIKKTSK